MRAVQQQSRNFKEWLEWEHSILHPMILDDDLSDAFDEWISELTKKDVEGLADRYAKDVAYREAVVFMFDNAIV